MVVAIAWLNCALIRLPLYSIVIHFPILFIFRFTFLFSLISSRFRPQCRLIRYLVDTIEYNRGPGRVLATRPPLDALKPFRALTIFHFFNSRSHLLIAPRIFFVQKIFDVANNPHF